MLGRITNSTLVFFLLNLVILKAQVVLQADKIPDQGDLYENKTITDTTIQPGPSGANQTWDFHNFFVWPAVISENYRNLTGTANDNLFPSANMKVTSFFGGDDYYLKTANDLQFLGTKSMTSEIFITNVQRVLNTPLAFGDSIVNSSVAGNGLGYQLSGTIKVKADGWGSLTLFTGNFASTLRVFTDIDLILGAGTSLDTYVHIRKYTWYETPHKAPVFIIAILDIDGPLGNSHQKITGVSLLSPLLGIENREKNNLQFNVVPNPVTSNAKLSINLLHPSELNLTVSDVLGKIWKQESKNFNSGSCSYLMDLSGLPKGIYILSAITGSITRQQRIIID